MKFRQHRGGLEDSMTTLVEVDGLQGLTAHLIECLGPDFLAKSTVGIGRDEGPDHRIGWAETHKVYVDGFPVGYVDGLKKETT